MSQVWVVPRVDADGRVQWAADSDSQLTKGLAALLVNGLSGCTPEEIVRIDPSFIDMLGLTQALTPSRNNGFLNMFKLMQRKSLELLVQQSKQARRGSHRWVATEGTPHGSFPRHDVCRQRRMEMLARRSRADPGVRPARGRA